MKKTYLTSANHFLIKVIWAIIQTLEIKRPMNCWHGIIKANFVINAKMKLKRCLVLEMIMVNIIKIAWVAYIVGGGIGN